MRTVYIERDDLDPLTSNGPDRFLFLSFICIDLILNPQGQELTELMTLFVFGERN